MLLVIGDLAGQGVSGPAIILIEKGNQTTLTRQDALVPGRRDALIRLIVIAQPWLVVHHLLHNCAALIGGAVINDEHLIGRNALGQDAVERLANKTRPVIERDDNTNQRCHDYHSPVVS